MGPGSIRRVVPEGQRMVDASQARSRAKAVLESLLEARRLCSEHDARTNRSDLYKAVTGKSALDAAITQTQRMIDSLDRSLARAGAEVEVRAAGILASSKERIAAAR